MEINQIILKYRNYTGITQGIFIDEIKRNSGINISLGTLNGIEHTGSVADKTLESYFLNRFYLNEIDLDKEIIDYSHKIASYCVENEKELGIESLFSFTRIEEFALFLEELGEEFINNFIGLHKLPTNIEVSEDFYNKNERKIHLNQTAKYIYYIVYWYILLSHKEKKVLEKEKCSSEELCQIAEILGYKEYATTSGQSRGKINKSINKRLSLFLHIESFDFLKKVNQFYKKNFDSNLCEEASFKKIADNRFEDLTFEEMNDLVEIASRLDLNLQFSYAYYQGIIVVESLEYVNNFISKKFDSVSDEKIYQNIKPIVDSLISDYNKYYKIYLETRDLDTMKLLHKIRMTLFNIYRNIESIGFNTFIITRDKNNIDKEHKIELNNES